MRNCSPHQASELRGITNSPPRRMQSKFPLLSPGLRFIKFKITSTHSSSAPFNARDAVASEDCRCNPWKILHAKGFYRSANRSQAGHHSRAGIASMTLARSSIRKGFASQPSNPEVRHASRVSSNASAVTAMMRTNVCGQFWRTSLTTSMPPCTHVKLN